MMKQFLIVTTMCLFSLSTYADSSTLHQNCVSAFAQQKAPDQDAAEYGVFAENACNCLLEKSPTGDVSDKSVNRTCILSGMLHVVTDNLDKDTSADDMTKACNSMVSVNNSKPSKDDETLVNGFCQCAQPKLLELFKQSDAMSDKQYNDGITAIAQSCSSN
jgi:hypothetical protein